MLYAERKLRHPADRGDQLHRHRSYPRVRDREQRLRQHPGPAYGFGAGAHTFSSVAADVAGNQGHATTSFTVIPTAADLCTLTKQFVEGSAKFQALGTKQQAAVDAIITGACNAIAKIVVNLGPKQKAVLVALYQAGVASLAQGGWLTSAQAANLDQLAGTL